MSRKLKKSLKKNNWWNKKKKQKNIRREKYKQKLISRVKQGKCKRNNYCKESIAGETQYCLKHWCDLIKNNNHGKKKANFDVDLHKIWLNQKGKCAVTGVDLIPGKTASLDHWIPLSKGGTNDADNLKFVHIAVNCFKQARTPQEFKEDLKLLLPALMEFIKEK